MKTLQTIALLFFSLLYSIGFAQAPVLSGSQFISHNGVMIFWNSVPGAINYRVDISTNNFSSFVSGFEDYMVSATPIGGMVRRNFIGLEPSTEYKLRVRTNTGSGVSGNSNVVTFTTVEIPPEASPLIWQTGFGNEGAEQITRMTLGNDGFLYVVGSYEGLMDFSGTLLQSIGSRDGFVAKYTTAGFLIWVKSIGGVGGNTEIWGVTTDANSLYLYGIFNQTINIEINGGNSVLTNRGTNYPTPLDHGDGFVVSYDLTNSAVNWGISLGDAFPITGNPIQSDGSNIFITGTFMGSNDFDAGVGTGVTSSVGNDDIFVASYNASNGGYNWAGGFGGEADFDWGYSLLIQGGYLYTVGIYSSQGDLDPGPGQIIPPNHGGYISKFNKSDGHLVWVKALLGSTVSYVSILDIAIDASSIFISGDFRGPIDFDPGPGEAIRNSNGNSDGFFAKYSLDDGEFIWVQTLAGSGATSDDLSLRKIVIDNTSIYLGGNVQWSADYDPGIGEANRTGSDTDVFLANYQKSDGSFNWAKTIGGSDFDFMRGGLEIGPDGIYLGAKFTGLVNFDPYTGSEFRNSTGNYVTVTKYELEDMFPEVPVATSATEIVDTSVKANWESASDATSYRFEISADDFVTFVTGYNDRSVSGLEIDVKNLSGGITYKYRVRAVNALGVSANSNSINFKTKGSQIIDFPLVADKSKADGSFTLNATSTSGLTITYKTTDSKKITLVGSTATIVSEGRATIEAIQPGNVDYASAQSVSRSFCINPERPSIIRILNSNNASYDLTSSSDFGNQWFFNGNPIENAINKDFTAMENGTYSLKVTVEGCASPPSEDVSVVISADTSDYFDFTVGPNPAKDYLLINESVQNLAIKNLQGVNMETRNIEIQGLTSIDVRNYPSGLYLLQFRKAGKLKLVKFIKE